MKEVQEEGFKDHGGTALLAGDAVKVAATQAGTQRTHGPAGGDPGGDDGSGVLIFNAVGDGHPRQKPRLALIESAGQQVNRQEAAPLQFVPDGEAGGAVLAARKANQPTGAGFDNAISFGVVYL